jgi:hypothetical protein
MLSSTNHHNKHQQSSSNKEWKMRNNLIMIFFCFQSLLARPSRPQNQSQADERRRPRTITIVHGQLSVVMKMMNSHYSLTTRRSTTSTGPTGSPNEQSLWRKCFSNLLTLRFRLTFAPFPHFLVRLFGLDQFC